MPEIVVFYQTKCPFSTGTLTFLTTVGLEYTTRNVNAHPGERERLTPLLGGHKFETPTLKIGDSYHVAPSLSELKKLTQPFWPTT